MRYWAGRIKHGHEAYPSDFNICLPNKRRPQLAQERKSVATAIAEAEAEAEAEDGVNPSTGYACIDC